MDDNNVTQLNNSQFEWSNRLMTVLHPLIYDGIQGIFQEAVNLCKNSEEAITHYAKARTYNMKGVTIPSQIRYIEYFESFLATNFCPPYIFLIPKIVKYHINVDTKNILKII